MSLNIATGATPSKEAVDRQISRSENQETLLTPEQVAVELADAYDTYAKEGTLPGADLTTGGTKSLLEAGFISDNTSATIDRIAEGICDYWISNNTPGTPAHGGTSVVSVTIDANSKLADMKAAIAALVTDEPVSGFMDVFYQATQDVVKTIPCTIVEMISRTPTPFEETIT